MKLGESMAKYFVAAGEKQAQAAAMTDADVHRLAEGMKVKKDRDPIVEKSQVDRATEELVFGHGGMAAYRLRIRKKLEEAYQMGLEHGRSGK